jgi:parallel beta-helix repeat protein
MPRAVRHWRRRRGSERWRRLAGRLAGWSVAALLCASQPRTAQAVTCGETVLGAVTLTADLSCPSGHGLLLGAGAALDCAGHTISGGRVTGQYGIYLRDVAGAVVRNCTVQDFEVGIRLRGATDCALYDSVTRDNTRYGLEVTQSSARARIWRNGVHTNGDEGMHISGPAAEDAGHQILENVLDGNALEGIYLLDSDGNVIAGNTIQNHGAAGMYVKGSSRNSIADNVLTNDAMQLVAGSELNVLTGNAVIGRKIKFDGASRNHVYTTSVQAVGGSPAEAYDFVNAADNRLVDVEAVDPGDHHVRATSASTGNAFVRFTTVPALRCFVEAGSSVTATDPRGVPLACGAPLSTTATEPPTTTTTTTTSTTTIATSTTVAVTTTTLAPPRTIVRLRVAASSDDAEERPSRSAQLTSSDLELVEDDDEQTVGLRFRGVGIPAGAEIVDAYVQFQVDEKTDVGTTLVVHGEYAGDAAAFVAATGNISSRQRTQAVVTWSPPPWTSTGQADAAQRTPNIAAIIREIVGHPEWRAGNALVIIVMGTGRRVAESYDGSRTGAPLLHVEYAG